MDAVEDLRSVISARLTEAVEEILGVFTRTVSAYEQEIRRQRALLALVLRPQVRLHRTELPLQDVSTGVEELLADQQLCFQERSSGLDREDPGPTRVKEEPEELYGGPEEERLVLKQETDFSKSHEINDQREGRTLLLDPDRNQKAAEDRPPDCGPPDCGPPDCGPADCGPPDCGPPDCGPPDCGPADCGPADCATRESERSVGGRRFIFHASRTTKAPPGAEPSDKPFECDVCGRDFYLYTHLKVHMMTHGAGKPFSCAACGKGFGFKRNLKRHMATHSGERPHACDRCPRTFRRVEHLRVHTRSHTGERPYRCAYCEKAMSTNSALAKHVRRHAEERTADRFEPEETLFANV